MRSYATAFAIFALVFLGLDFIWLTAISASFYKQMIGHLLADEPNLLAAAGFYVAYLAGAFYFCVVPAVKKGRSFTAAKTGAFFGFVAYATYDLTNMATLKGWPLTVTLTDLAWGTFLTGVSAATSVVVTAFLKAKAGQRAS